MGPVEYFQTHNNFILLDILSKSIFDFNFMYKLQKEAGATNQNLIFAFQEKEIDSVSDRRNYLAENSLCSSLFFILAFKKSPRHTYKRIQTL